MISSPRKKVCSPPRASRSISTSRPFAARSRAGKASTTSRGRRTGPTPRASFGRPDSKIRRPQDLKDVPVSVGMRAGSHFNVPYRLEKYLPLEHIKVVNTGGFGARLRALLDGEVEAASLLPPQIAMAEQLGLRQIIEDTFHTLWWVPENSEPEVVRGYLR